MSTCQICEGTGVFRQGHNDSAPQLTCICRNSKRKKVGRCATCDGSGLVPAIAPKGYTATKCKSCGGIGVILERVSA